MALKVIWLPKAENNFQIVIDYLESNWTTKEVQNFVQLTDKTIKYIKIFPRLFRKSKKNNVFEALITKHNLMIYQIRNNQIEILTFFDTRQHPKKKMKKCND